MKRVRYLAAAAGLAPMALAAAMTPAAPRTASTADAGHAKTVSLNPVIAMAGCGGRYLADEAVNSSSNEQFYYTPETNGLTCIGTVQYLEMEVIGTGYDLRTRIWAPNLQYSHLNTGTISPLHVDISFADAVRSYFGAGNVEVCTAMVKATNPAKPVTGPLCDTVP